MIYFSELPNILDGEVIQLPQPQLEVQHLLTDSRSGIQNEAALFFAISGERHDGHHYLSDLHRRGVRQFIIEQLPSEELPEANIMKVDNSIRALQQLVAYYRQQFSVPLVGVTGSNGKTIVKEWLGQLLSLSERVIRNPKSYNSQIGVPLAVWNMNASHSIGIFEAGISQVGEMVHLAKILEPTIGIFTNIGSAHDEGFENRGRKVREKAKLFTTAERVIYRYDYSLIRQVLHDLYAEEKCIGWSTQSLGQSDYKVQWSENDAATEIHIQLQRSAKKWTFNVPFRDDTSLENITHILVFGIVENYPVELWKPTLKQLKPVSMRMEWKQGINQCYVVDDSYSSDLVSLQLALDFLKQQTQNESYTVILSDILQSGEPALSLYRDLVDLLEQKGIGRFIGIGPELTEQQSLFQNCSFQTELYVDPQDFLNQFQSSSFRHENVLVKGARTFHLERIVQRLQQKIHSTVLEINLDALTHNLNVYRSKLSPKTKIMVMVKAFSYGGASFEIANLLQFHQVDYLGVAYADEGVRLREHGVQTPIVVLNSAVEAFEKMYEYRLEPEIYSLSLLSQFEETLGEKAAQLPIHLKLDTGMHRLGFSPQKISHLTDTLQQHSLSIASIFSHLAASDEVQHDAFTEQQIQQFEQGYEQIAEAIGYRPMRHVLNSSGIIRFPQYQYEMVRLGIGLYGVDSSRQEPERLQTVGTLKTVISQIKHLKKGETVGYGRRGVANQDMTIATVAIGYADGFDRGFGNGNVRMMVNDHLAPTVGSICMDMTMIDITGIDASEGDEVIVFGSEISVESLAQKIDTIPYEILTNIGERVKRVFYRES